MELREDCAHGHAAIDGSLARMAQVPDQIDQGESVAFPKNRATDWAMGGSQQPDWSVIPYLARRKPSGVQHGWLQEKTRGRWGVLPGEKREAAQQTERTIHEAWNRRELRTVLAEQRGYSPPLGRRAMEPETQPGV